MSIMKTNNDFKMRKIADEFILIPVGSAVYRYTGVISLNESAGFLFQLLSQECTTEMLMDEMIRKYGLDEKTAWEDVEDFLQQLRSLGALVEK